VALGPLRSPVASLPPAPLCRRVAPPKRSGKASGGAGSASPGFLVPRRNYVGCPVRSRRQLSRRRDGRGSPNPRRCRPQGSCPSRRIRPRSRIVSDSSRRPPVSVAPRRFAALFHAARALDLPFRAFPSRGAVPALAGPCFLAGSRSTAAGAATSSLRGAFPVATTLCHDSPEGERDWGAGTTVPCYRWESSSCAPECVDRSSSARDRRARR
jgi:hypothetical protein